MAITKLLRLKESKAGNPAQHLINNIRYICNPEKTEGELWIGGNAGQETATIISTMLRNKKLWNKQDGTQGFHYVISFSPDCQVSEQTASEFADDFVQELLHGEFYYVTAVHNQADYDTEQKMPSGVLFAPGGSHACRSIGINDHQLGGERAFSTTKGRQ